MPVPAYRAALPSSDSMRSSWLYLATRSERHGAPVLICPVHNATARSARLSFLAFREELVGQGAGGARVVRRGEVHALVRAVDAGWRVQRLEVRDLEEVTTPRPVFHDVSRQVGVSLGRTRYTDDALHAQLEVLDRHAADCGRPRGDPRPARA